MNDEVGQKIIPLFQKKFPQGTYAWHNYYGYCRVIALDGDQATIRVIRKALRGCVYKTYEIQLNELEEIVTPLLDDRTLELFDIPIEDPLQ